MFIPPTHIEKTIEFGNTSHMIQHVPCPKHGIWAMVIPPSKGILENEYICLHRLL
jgi:hypothetical protein